VTLQIVAGLAVAPRLSSVQPGKAFRLKKAFFPGQLRLDIVRGLACHDESRLE
jgi:hypothetical protein